MVCSEGSRNEAVEGKKFQLAEDAGRLTIHPGNYCLSLTLVWMPCRQSFSPHLPFYKLTVGGQNLYIRADGEVFTYLTITGRGV